MHGLHLRIGAAFLFLLFAAPGVPAMADEAADVASVHAFIDSVATRFNSGQLDNFMGVFTDDAEILSQGFPDIVGKAAIRSVYASAMAQYDMKVAFNTTEVRMAGGMAYEAGTYSVEYRSKVSGELLMTTHARHVHILLRDSSGAWHTWRMFTNSAQAAATQQTSN